MMLIQGKATTNKNIILLIGQDAPQLERSQTLSNFNGVALSKATNKNIFFGVLHK